VVVVEGPIPIFMTESYPAEELGECFPSLLPQLREILGQDFDLKGKS
jgi:hypothetical protein